MIASLFTFLDWLYPACAAFGPFFLLLGIFYRTSTQRETHPRLTNALLIASGVMITFALLQAAPMGVPGPK